MSFLRCIFCRRPVVFVALAQDNYREFGLFKKVSRTIRVTDVLGGGRDV